MASKYLTNFIEYQDSILIFFYFNSFLRYEKQITLSLMIYNNTRRLRIVEPLILLL